MFDDRIGNLQKMLARMGPEGRQRYAADHADDPIAVSMALFVNNIAKEIKEGKRGEPEVQTPVVQQAIQAMNQPSMPPQGVPPQGQPQAPQQAQQAPQQIQQQAPQAMPPQAPQQQAPQQQAPQQQRQTRMAADGGYMDSRLPEEMGIGALPERSLSNMADGGIVGFAERGLVSDLPGGAIERARRAILEKRAAEERLTPRRGYMTTPEMYDQDTQNAYQQPQETPANVAQQTALPPALPSAAPAAPPSAAARATPPAAARPAAPPAARPAAATPTGAPPAANAAAGLQSLATKDLTAQDIVNARKDIAFLQDPVVDPLKEERQKIVDADKASGLEELQQHRDRVAKQGDPYAKQEERANKQEASVAESAERNPYLALMEAGFAAMAGDSPYAMVNLGKGALAGTKTYRDGLALIEKAKEKLTETRDRIDGLRLIRSDLNASEERTILNQNRKTALDGVRFMFEGISKATGDSKAQIENTLNIFTAAETARRLADRQYNTEVMKQGEETKRAEFNARTQTGIAAANRALQEKIAGMPGATQQLILALGEGNIKEGYRLYNERPKQDDQLFLDWSKRSEDPYTGEEFRKRYPTAQVYVEAARRNGTGVVDVDTPLRTR